MKVASIARIDAMTRVLYGSCSFVVYKNYANRWYIQIRRDSQTEPEVFHAVETTWEEALAICEAELEERVAKKLEQLRDDVARHETALDGVS